MNGQVNKAARGGNGVVLWRFNLRDMRVQPR